MKAVNLVPIDTRGRPARLSTSPQMLAAIGGLAFILLAAVLYVSAANTVSTRQRELAQVTAGAASWTVAANRYAPFLQAAERNIRQLANIRALAAARFPWSRLLGQISGLMPRAAALSTLQATTTPTTATSTAAAPAVQLTGCAASQSTVARAMVQLRRINGVSAVTLASSADITASAGASGASAGGCPFPVQFQASLSFGASSAAGAASSSAAPAASAAATSVPASSAPAASAPATAAPVAAATGAAQ